MTDVNKQDDGDGKAVGSSELGAQNATLVSSIFRSIYDTLADEGGMPLGWSYHTEYVDGKQVYPPIDDKDSKDERAAQPSDQAPTEQAAQPVHREFLLWILGASS